MGWIAVSGGAVAAAFAVHSFLSRNGRREVTTNRTQSPLDKDGENSKAQDPLSFLQHKPTPSLPGLLGVSPPDIIIEKEEDFPLHLQQTTLVPERPSQPSVLMPPPPAPRGRSSSPPRLKAPVIGSMPAPPRPSKQLLYDLHRPLQLHYAVPQTKVLSSTSMAPSLGVCPRRKSSKAGYSGSWLFAA